MDERRLQTRMFHSTNPDDLCNQVNTFIAGRTADINWWEAERSNSIIACVDITDVAPTDDTPPAIMRAKRTRVQR